MMRRLPWISALAGALLLSACATTVPIGRINADPSRFVNRLVRVNGTVTTSFGALGKGGYQIEDATGKIFVVSASGVPNTGSRVVVTGGVFSGVNIAGRSLGTAIRERNHKVKY